MIKKRYTIFLCLVLLFSGCNRKSHTKSLVDSLEMSMLEGKLGLIDSVIQESSNLDADRHENYSLSLDSFEKTNEDEQINILIRYPQLAEMKDLTKQKNINFLIQEAALSPYNKVLNENMISEGTQWSIEYSIEYTTKNLISIKFQGLLYSLDYSGKGVYWVYTTNIDLSTGKILTMSDLFNNSIRERIDNKHFKCIDIDTRDSDKKSLEDIFNNNRDRFEGSNDNFYFTKDKFIIIFPINGVYYQFASDYEELKSSMKADSIWKEIWGKNYDEELN